MISLRWQLIATLFYGCSAVAIGAYVVDLKWQSDWDAHMLSDAKANQKAAEDVLKRQQNLQTELEEAYATAKNMQDDHQRNMANADSAAKRLQHEIDRFKAMPKGSNPSPIAERAAAANDRVVLANLLAISDTRAGEYAKHADELRQAVINCNNEYSAVRANR